MLASKSFRLRLSGLGLRLRLEVRSHGRLVHSPKGLGFRVLRFKDNPPRLIMSILHVL